jgi:hypothetical protein
MHLVFAVGAVGNRDRNEALLQLSRAIALSGQQPLCFRLHATMTPDPCSAFGVDAQVSNRVVLCRG